MLVDARVRFLNEFCGLHLNVALFKSSMFFSFIMHLISRKTLSTDHTCVELISVDACALRIFCLLVDPKILSIGLKVVSMSVAGQ